MPTQGIHVEFGEGARIVERSVGEAARRDLDARLEAIHALFQRERDASIEELAGHLRAWSRSHEQSETVAEVVRLAERARADFDVLVTVGIGGSDLSARVFHDVLNHAYHNRVPAERRGGAPEAYFTGDTFDPRRLRDLLDMLDARNLLSRTLFNVISKSGRTGETIATLMIIRDRLRRRLSLVDPEAWRQQVVATTGLNDQSALYRLHQERPFYGETLLPVPDGVGGRYSAFSPVGLFFLAMTAGGGETPESRVQALLDGVREAAALFHSPREGNGAYALARWLHLAETWDRRGTLVFYNFADNRPLGDWFVQLYEESIQERGQGLNVISTCGPTGNHSILNGILGGPRDKVVLFLRWQALGEDLIVPTATGIGGDLDLLEGKAMAAIQTASYRGTAEDFTANGVPNVTLALGDRSARSLGRLMRFLMDTVAVKGRLQGLHVNEAGSLDLSAERTYTQDGVEGYKERTRRIAATLARPS